MIELDDAMRAMAMLVAMVDKNRRSIQVENADTFYLDRNTEICRTLVNEWEKQDKGPTQ